MAAFCIMKLSKLKKNPNNPRILKDDKFEKLKRSVQDFPQMMELRPILISVYSDPGDLIAEAFGGSGTTFVACENVKRICYAAELEPKFCAVILERMTTAFPGLEIKKL